MAAEQQRSGLSSGNDDCEQYRPWPEQIDLRNVDVGLLRFCLIHSDGGQTAASSSGIPARDPADYRWLREALDSLEDDAKKMLKLVVALREGTDLAANLERFEELLEEVSNANDFAKVGGVPVVTALLAHADPAVRANAAWVLSAVAVNNRPGQAVLVAGGAVAATVRALRSSGWLCRRGGECCGEGPDGAGV